MHDRTQRALVEWAMAQLGEEDRLHWVWRKKKTKGEELRGVSQDIKSRVRMRHQGLPTAWAKNEQKNMGGARFVSQMGAWDFGGKERKKETGGTRRGGRSISGNKT